MSTETNIARKEIYMKIQKSIVFVKKNLKTNVWEMKSIV